MKLIQESDLYSLITSSNENQLNQQAGALVTTNCIFVHKELEYTLTMMEKAFRDPLSTASINAVKEGKIQLLVAKDPSAGMPIYMPFVKYNTGSGIKVAIDLTQFASYKVDRINNELSISIDTAKLYTLMSTAYVYLNFANKNTALPPLLIELTASVWAKIFVRIFDNKLGLSTNRERKEAFMYFAESFYCRNILECPEGIASTIPLKVFPTKRKSALVSEIEERVGTDIYSSFTTFVTTLLNSDITGLRADRAHATTSALGVQYYMKEFVVLYGAPSAFAVAAFPYFMWMVFSANNHAWMFTGEKTIETMSKNEYPKIAQEIYRMIKI